MHTSVLAREELRIFEELISQFDSLSKAEMRAVGVTREWPAKDNQHALGVRGPQGDNLRPALLRKLPSHFRLRSCRPPGSWPDHSIQGRFQELTARGLTKLAKLDEDQGHIVSERTVSPLSDAVQDGLLHLGEGLLC